MTRRKSIEEHLAPVPASIRRDMIENRDSLAPGAAAVIGRFFAIVDAPGLSVGGMRAGSNLLLLPLARILTKPDIRRVFYC